MQSLKLDKGISIFPGVNGPGNVLVAKDFSVEKQKLQVTLHFLISLEMEQIYIVNKKGFLPVFIYQKSQYLLLP